MQWTVSCPAVGVIARASGVVATIEISPAPGITAPTKCVAWGTEPLPPHAASLRRQGCLGAGGGPSLTLRPALGARTSQLHGAAGRQGLWLAVAV
jgi:hypothetical protein